MTEYALIKANGAINACRIVSDPDFSGDWWSRYFPSIKEEESCWAVGIDKYTEPPTKIKYAWELSGPDGAHYFLFPEAHHTKEDTHKTKQFFRHLADVTGFTVVRVVDC